MEINEITNVNNYETPSREILTPTNEEINTTTTSAQEEVARDENMGQRIDILA